MQQVVVGVGSGGRCSGAGRSRALAGDAPGRGRLQHLLLLLLLLLWWWLLLLALALGGRCSNSAIRICATDSSRARVASLPTNSLLLLLLLPLLCFMLLRLLLCHIAL